MCFFVEASPRRHPPSFVPDSLIRGQTLGGRSRAKVAEEQQGARSRYLGGSVWGLAGAALSGV